MNIPLSIILDKRQVKKNGTYPLKLRVYYRQAFCYGLVYDLSEADYSKLEAKRINDDLTKLRNTLNDIVEAAKKLADQLQPFSHELFYDRFIYKNPHFKQSKKKIKAEPAVENKKDVIPAEWRKSFKIFDEPKPGPSFCSSVFAGIIKSLLYQARVGTAGSYQTAYHSLKKFRGDIRVNEITPAYLKEYEGWMMNQKGRSKTTVGIHARCFRAIINEAIELKLMSRDDYPFGRRRYRIPTGKNIKKAMDKESIAKLYYTEAETYNQQKGKDFWFFSFFGNGMNVKDMVSLKYGDIKGEFLVFERAKTQLTTMRDPIVISCFLNSDMRKTIEKYGNADMSPSNYIFTVLTHGLTPIRMDDLIHNFVAFINHNMAKICQKANLPKNVGTMETRHSASTIMKNAGVSPHYIKEQLGHTSLQTTENYLAGFENRQKKEFAKVLESFKKFKPKKG